MTEEMIERANINKNKLGISNVKFRHGDIENLPVEDNTIDVIVSNCVINLATDKRKVYAEIYRTLKQGAHFCISDIVTKGDLPEELKRSAELYTGCVAGAIDIDALLDMLEDLHFSQVKINSKKEIVLKDELLAKYLDDHARSEYRKKDIGIFSITLTGYK